MDNKGKNIAALVVVALIVIIAYRLLKSRNEQVDNSTYLAVDSANTSVTPVVSSSSYTNNTVFSLKSPMMSGQQVSWIQYEYNRLAKARISKGLYPYWPIIKQDGAFGSETKSAMLRMMKKSSVTYTQVKTKADQEITSLNVY